MGWVRCTYRNCTVKSDKKTHMFHFPVFDKIRCHQWLVNAKRLDLLNLTVSQLKNRSVCQHHFMDDLFMNPMKEKLKQYAIPTLDGPHCTVSDDPPDAELYLDISADLIDNEIPRLLTEREANYSTKYGNFLTNCEIMDDDNIHYTTVINKRQTSGKSNLSKKISTDIRKVLNPGTLKETKLMKYFEEDLIPRVPGQQQPEGQQTQQVLKTQHGKQLQQKQQNQGQQQAKKEVNQQVKNKVYVKTEDLGLIEQKPLTFDESKAVQEYSVHLVNPSDGSQEMMLPNCAYRIENIQEEQMFVNNSNKPKLHHPKVQILSVKTIMPGYLSTDYSMVPQQNNIEQPLPELHQTQEITNNCIHSAQSLNQIKHAIDTSKNSTEENTSTTVAPQEKTATKRKLRRREVCRTTPRFRLLRTRDEAAKIQEKRKFNMKLGDIIKNSLNELSKENFKDSLEMFKANEASKNRPKNKSILKKHSIATENVGTTSNDLVVSYLDARMKKMEDLLLNRIDSNSQKIIELKSALNQTMEAEAKEDTSSMIAAKAEAAVVAEARADAEAEAGAGAGAGARRRVSRPDDSRKKSLFNEISQFLKPETKSLLYEELFINKVMETVPRYSKRRKRTN